jgi:hypothetical protein
MDICTLVPAPFGSHFRRRQAVHRVEALYVMGAALRYSIAFEG